MRAKITSKGQITIPKAIRDELNVKPGDSLEFTVSDGHVEVEPVRRRSLSEFYGIFKPATPLPPDWTWEQERDMAWREATRHLVEHDEPQGE